MLNNSERKQLKALAAKSKIKYQIGKNEISDTVVAMLEKAIVAHELIKIDVMKSVSEDVMRLALDLANVLNAEIVQVVGNVIVIFRRNKENPKIILK